MRVMRFQLRIKSSGCHKKVFIEIRFFHSNVPETLSPHRHRLLSERELLQHADGHAPGRDEMWLDNQRSTRSVHHQRGLRSELFGSRRQHRVGQAGRSGAAGLHRLPAFGLPIRRSSKSNKERFQARQSRLSDSRLIFEIEFSSLLFASSEEETTEAAGEAERVEDIRCSKFAT